MRPVYFARQIAEMDECTIRAGASMDQLIDAAGAAVAESIRKIHPACPVVFFCGPGHNGADGLAAARVLAPSHGVMVFLFFPDKLKAATAAQRERLAQKRVRIIPVSDEESLKRALEGIGQPSVVVDALLGSGNARAPEGLMAAAVDAINSLSDAAEIVAIDLPTGTIVDSGGIFEKTVRARHTIALMGYKPAHLLYPAAQYAGGLRLSIPFSTDYKAEREMFWFQSTDVKSLLRNRGTHKGNYGCLLVVAGSRGYSGAGEMCARSALRSGCGTLVIASPESTASVYRNRLPEAMTYALPETAEGGFATGTSDFGRALKRASACVVGPGMGTGEGTMEIIEAVIERKIPAILDADALNTLAKHGIQLLRDAPQIVVTPHPRELSRLLGIETQQVLNDPIGSAERITKEYGCVCALKMASTVIASPDCTAITTTGCAGMAKGGSGDVLAGCIGSFLAQGMDPFYATCFAAHACGQAGQLAQRRLGATFMLPMDTIAQLSKVYKRYER